VHIGWNRCGRDDLPASIDQLGLKHALFIMIWRMLLEFGAARLNATMSDYCWHGVFGFFYGVLSGGEDE
jgi:hypothetical protein